MYGFWRVAGGLERGHDVGILLGHEVVEKCCVARQGVGGIVPGDEEGFSRRQGGIFSGCMDGGVARESE